MTDAALREIFTDRLEAVGGTVGVATDAMDAAGQIARWARETALGQHTVWTSNDALAAAPALVAALRTRGLIVARPDSPATVRDQPLGMTIARVAIAETGSVLLVETGITDRAVTLMTEALIVLIPGDRLVASLAEGGAALRRATAEGAPYATFVTGPSRTADIERQLTVGVQGPGRFHALFIEGGLTTDPDV